MYGEKIGILIEEFRSPEKARIREGARALFLNILWIEQDANDLRDCPLPLFLNCIK
jgi:hypothetical protein